MTYQHERFKALQVSFRNKKNESNFTTFEKKSYELHIKTNTKLLERFSKEHIAILIKRKLII